MKLLILGASGGCGRWLCRLAVERGHDVRALVRPTTSFEAPADVEVVRGEVLADPAQDPSLEHALEGRDAVLSALGIRRKVPQNPWSALASPPDLTTRVAERLVRAMPTHGVRRLVTISAAGVGASLRRTNGPMRWLIGHSNLGPAYRDLAGMEAVLAASDLDWLAVRPVTLTPPMLAAGPTGRARIVDRYGLLARIGRADVAAWMLDAVASSSPFGDRTPMIAG
ncbi:MAG: NAD(P)H-binding protein [Acidobacteriota bacterium]